MLIRGKVSTLVPAAAMLAVSVSQNPAFRSSTDLVALNVTVLDAQGHTVRSLPRDAPSGNTAIYATVSTALDTLQLSRHRRQALVLITDGKDERPEDRNAKSSDISPAMRRASGAGVDRVNADGIDQRLRASDPFREPRKRGNDRANVPPRKVRRPE
jgi:hypothetical protein